MLYDSRGKSRIFQGWNMFSTFNVSWFCVFVKIGKELNIIQYLGIFFL